MNVGDKGNVDLRDDFGEGGGISLCGHGDSDKPAAGFDQAVYLRDAALDVGRGDFGH
jgi:hypothetical protein